MAEILTFSLCLNRLMQKHDLTPHQLSSACGCSRSEIKQLLSRYENNEDWNDGFLEGLRLVYDHKTMIEHIYKFVDSFELRNYLDSIIFKHALTVIDKEFRKTSYDNRVKEIAADFYTNALLGATVKWIVDGMKQKPENMAALYSSVFYGTINQTFDSIDKALKQFSE